ncbi:hypothetical protein GCM10017781_18610 [Deinococcus metalli]|uniref:O-antigen ligase-related domain-containing protein n=1 Tax=Deinococcus metalli TaxID=1141878 RepID=A0ABQ3JMD3_9DEIO|nr:hypothetical protein GCM10017781_18610 [Deinococcus metalli]
MRGLPDVLTLLLAGVTVAWAVLAQGSTGGWGLDGLAALGSVTVLSAVLAASVRGRWPTTHPAWTLAAAALLVWIWLSTTWGPDHWQALRWAGAWTAIVGAAVCVHGFADTPTRRRAVLGGVIATGAAALLLAGLQLRGVGVPGFAYYPGAGPALLTGPYFNPSHFSGLLIPVAALLSSALLFTRPGWFTPLLLALLVALHVADFRTDSSSIPAVLLATVLPGVVWLWRRSPRGGALLTAALLTAALGTGTYFLSPAGQAQFAARQSAIGLSNSWTRFLTGRQAVWRYGREMWAASPVTGVGVGQFVREAPRFRAEERRVGANIDRQLVNYAHNDTLQMAAETGAVGAALYWLTLLLPLTSRSGRLAALTWWSALPALAFAGLYDAHLTAIPGTAAVAFTLLGLAAQRQERASSDAAAPPVHAS